MNDILQPPLTRTAVAPRAGVSVGLVRKCNGKLAISTSGNSPNVLRAAETAKKQGVIVVGLTGKDGGKLAPLCDVEVRVPHNGYADRVQEIHIKIIHALIDHIERSL